jgi:predicted ATP-dependent serine protease
MFTEELSDDKRIKIAPKALNDMIGGGAFPGHCIILFGRVEMGKSTGALNIAAGVISQGYRVLYIENEDTLLDTNRRFTQRLLRRPLEWCKENAEQAEAIALKRGIQRFILTDEPDVAADVLAAVRFYKPDVVVINQMRNMVSGDNQVSKLDSLAHALRRIGKQTRTLMLLVTAAREGDVARDGTIMPKPVLEIGDVYSSRTGIPAAADLLIGWGGSAQLHQNEQAILSIIKNKLVDAGGKGQLHINVNPRTGVIS